MGKKTDFKEECWLLYGLRLHTVFGLVFVGYQKHHAVGTAGGVDMDYATSNSPYVVGWYHTHPGVKNVTPSPTDNSTMRSWVKAVYKPYLCGIRCGVYESCYCYFVNGVNRENVTMVGKKKVKIRFYKNFFIGTREM